MSRLDRGRVWFQRFYHKHKALCPVCEKNMMYRDVKPTVWHIGHIIALSRKGPDIWPNVYPICKQCNLGMGNMSFYQYRYKLGMIDKDLAIRLEREKIASFSRYNPRCQGRTKIGSHCNRNTIGEQWNHCFRCLNVVYPVEPMDCRPDY